MLTSVKILASEGDLGQSSGLCGIFNRDLSDDLTMEDGQRACAEKAKFSLGGRIKKSGVGCVEFIKSWRLVRKGFL